MYIVADGHVNIRVDGSGGLPIGPPSGWCWENPLHIWVGCAEAGGLLHFDGKEWSTVVTGSDIALYEVRGGARDDVWAFAGNQDPLLHFDGVGWSAQRLPTHPVLMAMWGVGRNEERMVGDDGVILRRCP
jgi:hypothetical protein